MKNLDKILEIWTNLDRYYIKFKSEGKCKTKLDFIEYITDYNEKKNTTKIEYIKSKMAEEYKLYSEVELNKYSELISLLDGVNTLLLEGIESISDFEAFKKSCSRIDASRKSTTKLLSDNFFDSVKPIKLNTDTDVINEMFMSFENIYEAFKTLGDTIVLRDTGEVQAVKVINDYNDFFCILNEASVQNLATEYQTKNTPFKTTLLNLVGHLLNTDKLHYNSIYLGKKYYKIENDVAIVTIKNDKHECELHNRSKISYAEGEAYIVRVPTKDGFTKVYLV